MYKNNKFKKNKKLNFSNYNYQYFNNSNWYKNNIIFCNRVFNLSNLLNLNEYVIVYNKPYCYRCKIHLSIGYSKNHKIYCKDCFKLNYFFKNTTDYLIKREYIMK